MMDRPGFDLATIMTVWHDLDEDRRDDLLTAANNLYSAMLSEKHGNRERRIMRGFMDLGYRASELEASWAQRREADDDGPTPDTGNIVPFPREHRPRVEDDGSVLVGRDGARWGAPAGMKFRLPPESDQ